MREAVGGSMSLMVIALFLLIVNCYLAFSVNYTKAFRVKNEILSIIEKYEGLTVDARSRIQTYMNQTNYRVNEGFLQWCTANGYQVERNDFGSFCYKCEKVDQTGNAHPNSKYKGTYYSVATFVNIDIPMINNLLPVTGNIFRVEGETEIIYSSGNNSEVCPNTT
ncbi:MAG: hypothetical protein PUB18_06020 [bacterium]|nr:hypothetical protein [bacterium]